MHTWRVLISEFEFNMPVQSRAMHSGYTNVNENTSDREESASSSRSTEPDKFRLLSDVYNDTEKIDLPEEMMLLGVEEPSSFDQAVKDTEWKNAIRVEMEAIEKNKTWVLTDLPRGRKPITLKWIYKLKKNTEGDIVKYKARTVARGYVQKKGVDFEEVFAPVRRLKTVRLLLALAVKEWVASTSS